MYLYNWSINVYDEIYGEKNNGEIRIKKSWSL